MTARIIDGKALAATWRDDVARRAHALRRSGRPARLDAVIVDSGDNAARLYAQKQADECGTLNIEYRLHTLAEASGEADIAGAVRTLSESPDVTALMVHMPLPPGVDQYRVKAAIAPDVDVEGVNPANIGGIIYGRSAIAPCTALAVLALIDSTGLDLRARRAVVVGASNTVGKPIAALLMSRDATVISCNQWTWGIEDLCRSAEVLVTAVGKPGLITADMVRPGAVVVDVGTTRVRGEDGVVRTLGDVAYEPACRVAGWLTPVPGGVGPMTVAVLLRNVVELAEQRQAGGTPPPAGLPAGPTAPR